MSEIGNMIFAYMRGQVMAANPQYAKQVYTERAIEQNKKYVADIVKHMPNQADRDYYSSLLNAGRLDEADDFLKSQNPNFQLHQRFTGTDGNMYGFDARRGVTYPLSQNNAPITDPKYDIDLQGNLAESRSRNQYRKFDYPDGSYTIDTIENQQAGGHVPMQGGQSPMQNGQPPMQDGGQSAPFDIQLPADTPPQVLDYADSIAQGVANGEITPEAGMRLMQKLGGEVRQGTTQPQPQTQPMPEQTVPQMQPEPQSMMPDLRPPQPRMGPYGQSSPDKSALKMQEDVARAKAVGESRLEATNKALDYKTKVENQHKLNMAMPLLKDSLRQLNSITSHKALDAMTGLPSGMSSLYSKMTPMAEDGSQPQAIAGTPEADFVSRFNGYRNKIFLQAYESLRGAAGITDVEGKKATEAMSRLSTALGKNDFIAAAEETRKLTIDRVNSVLRTLGKSPIDLDAQEIDQTDDGNIVFKGKDGRWRMVD